jgi:hypothetical protein
VPIAALAKALALKQSVKRWPLLLCGPGPASAGDTGLRVAKAADDVKLAASSHAHETGGMPAAAAYDGAGKR